MSGWQSWDVIRCEVEKKNLRLFLNGLLDFVETQFNIDTCWFPHAGATRGHAHRLLREQLDEASLSWYIQRIFRFDPIPTTFMIFRFTSERVNLVCVCVCVGHVMIKVGFFDWCWVFYCEALAIGWASLWLWFGRVFWCENLVIFLLWGTATHKCKLYKYMDFIKEFKWFLDFQSKH